jgi:glycosyltransferase involved in cell wall biosynthesis
MGSIRPLVTVGMAVHNQSELVGAAVRSILNQSLGDWELLAVDDGSSDRTQSVLRTFTDRRIRVIHDGRRLGLAARLNQLVDMSQGPYFARMDADDVAYPERFQRQVEFLMANPEIDLVACNVVVFRSDGRGIGCRRSPQSHFEICRHPAAGFALPHPSWMGKLEWFRSNRYSPELTSTQDQDLLLRSYAHSKFACLPDILLGYREDRLSLRKILRGRRNYSLALIRYFRSKGNYFSAVQAVGAQCVKGFCDILAVGVGLDYQLLRHRAEPADEATLQRWKTVWTQVQAESEAGIRIQCAG